MRRHASFAQPSLLDSEGLSQVAMLFAIWFDRVVQVSTGVFGDEDDVEMGETHGYADHTPVFYREGFGFPDLVSCFVRVRGTVEATTAVRLYAVKDGSGWIRGELEAGEEGNTKLYCLEGNPEVIVQQFAALAFEELKTDFTR